MHTLLIVDDEEIEREGMAQFIPWDTYKMKVVGTARNGAEGLEKIAKYKPDLAIVDIKMPVMNGIEMIRKAKEQYPDMTFVVLSGYGDYEFTSQAMELGVRHYILKPCDEGKMIPVLNKAIAELDEARAQNAHSAKLENEARLLKPYAREQLFRDLLQGRALPQGSCWTSWAARRAAFCCWTSGSSAGSTRWSGMWWAICWETFCRTAPC